MCKVPDTNNQAVRLQTSAIALGDAGGEAGLFCSPWQGAREDMPPHGGATWSVGVCSAGGSAGGLLAGGLGGRLQSHGWDPHLQLRLLARTVRAGWRLCWARASWGLERGGGRGHHLLLHELLLHHLGCGGHRGDHLHLLPCRRGLRERHGLWRGLCRESESTHQHSSRCSRTPAPRRPPLSGRAEAEETLLPSLWEEGPGGAWLWRGPH